LKLKLFERNESVRVLPHSSDAFFEHLIDYAGLFPPTQLPLQIAITNYASYITRKGAWKIGPFVHLANTLNELDPYVSLFSKEHPLSISALGRKGQSERDSFELLEEDLKAILSFRERHGERVSVDFLELPIPSLNVTSQYISELHLYLTKYNLFCYCELPINEEEINWEDRLKDAIASIAKQNRIAPSLIGAKLRTGGIRADLIPSVEIVASFIHSCKTHKVPSKFTAGLHHPIRMYRDEVQTEMHGYLNVFIAGMMAHTHDLEKETIIDILETQESSGISFEQDKIIWNGLEVTTDKIIELRRSYLRSYGSCSFEGPMNEFKTLNVLERG
jgi:hypothetical protein